MMKHLKSPILELHTVNLKLPIGNKSFIPILQDITFNIEPAEKIAICGPSGAGKSSLLLLLAGLQQASSGSIIFDGEDISRFTENKAALFRRQRLAIVFQSFRLVPTMTALENTMLPLELAGTKNAETTAKKYLEAVGLQHRLEHFPTQLSGGEQQRVAIARALAAQPKVLLADEPTGNLDQETGSLITDLLFSMQKEYGFALVLVTHDLALAQRCGRILTVTDGKIASDTKTDT